MHCFLIPTLGYCRAYWVPQSYIMSQLSSALVVFITPFFLTELRNILTKSSEIRLDSEQWSEKNFNWLKPGSYAPVRMSNIWWVLREISNIATIFLLAIFSARSSPDPEYLYVTWSLSRKWYVHWHSKRFALRSLNTFFITEHFKVFFIERKLMILLLEHASMMWYKVMSPAPLYPLVYVRHKLIAKSTYLLAIIPLAGDAVFRRDGVTCQLFNYCVKLVDTHCNKNIMRTKLNQGDFWCPVCRSHRMEIAKVLFWEYYENCEDGWH